MVSFDSPAPCASSGEKFQCPRISPGDQLLAEKPDDSGCEITSSPKSSRADSKWRYLEDTAKCSVP